MIFSSRPLNKKNNGNVLFLILIAVALFAALSYAVTQSGRTSGSTIDQEKTGLILSEIENYAAAIQQAATRLKTVNGCASGQLSFQTNKWKSGSVEGNYLNNASPTDNTCHIFHPAGGGVPFQTPPEDLHRFKDNYIFNAPKMESIGTNENEGIIVTIVNRDICLAANNKYSIENPAGEPPTSTAEYGITSTFDGNDLYAYSTGCCGKSNAISHAGTKLGTGARASQLEGKYSGCFQETSTAEANYLLYHVFERN